tara:strand:+ start:55 stop:258 length:204 start_codon:yes stop_codon:yes gene_type:complete
MEPLDEKVLLEVIESMLESEHLQELSELDAGLAMGIVEIVEDSIRLYHAKKVQKFFKEMEEEHLSKL